MKKYAIEFRKQSEVELVKESLKLKNEINKLKIEWGINKPKNTNIISNKLKRLSVLMTILGEKKELEKLEVKK
ncbi:MAG: hypothetical protein Q8P65_01505 [bacterium]|nr:hypothetical protein [bacterium]